MFKELLAMALILFAASIIAIPTQAQTSRASVPASEVNGTFRHYFSGKYKGSFSEIKILALGKGQLRVAFDLTYPFTDGTGEISANLGEADGIAAISGDTAVYRTNEFGGECTITIKFVKPGTIRVDQEGASTCGFGHNVSPAGTYARSSKLKPKFEREH